MNKQQLASKIWSSANNLRSKIEASEYKDYILGFIFYKFLSENEVRFLKSEDCTDDDIKDLSEDDQEVVSFVKHKCGYFISYKDLFSYWIQQSNDFSIDNVRTALSAFSRNIATQNKKLFDGIFTTLETGLSKLGHDAKSQTKAVRDLIHLIKDIPMDGKQNYDVLGFIYEYLISNFAANAGKKAGEFYTPHEISVLMSEIVAGHLKGRKDIKIYDPTSGSGSLLINIGKAVASLNGNPDSIKYYAQELKENTYNLTRMNLIMRGILPTNIVVRNGDTLEDDWPYFDTVENKESTYERLFVDAVVSNPPYSQKWHPEDKELDTRFSYGLAPKSKADYAFLLHDLYHLKSDGIMTIVLPHGVLFRGGEEGEIRKNLVENRHIQAIIGLPANIFFGTGIPTIIMVLRKERNEGDDHVLIIDASKHFIKDGKNNRLQASDIKRIVDTLSANKTVAGFSRLVSIDEIRQNEYNLNIPRYVDSSEGQESFDIYATMFGGVPKAELEKFAKYFSVWTSLKNELYTDDGSQCLQIKCDDLKKTVKEDLSVMDFKKAYQSSIQDLPGILRESLIKNVLNVDCLAEEKIVSDHIAHMVKDISLVDYYAIYQVLDDAWLSLATDIETIQTEGFNAIRTVDPNMVLKTKNGKKVEVQDGYKGRILPFSLVQNRFFKDELKEITVLENELAQIDADLTEIIENIDEEDKSDEVFNEQGDAFVSKALKARVKDIGKSPENDFEQSLIKAKKLLDKQSTKKKELNQAQNALQLKTKSCIETLSDEQCNEMLEAKWITPLQQDLNSIADIVVDEFISHITAINEKYSTTFTEICNHISNTESSFSTMLADITGSDSDLAGLSELQKLLGND